MFCAEAYSLGNRTAWLNLAKSDCDDVGLGNALAHAVNKLFGFNEGVERLLDFNATYGWQLRKLEPYTRLPGLLTIVLSGAEHAPKCARELLDLQSPSCKIILITEGPFDLTFPVEGCVISRDELRLTRGEVLGAVPGLLRRAQLEAIWLAHEGRPLDTKAAIAAELGATFHVPGPRTSYVGQFDLLAPELVVHTLMKEKEYTHLLSYMVERVPEQLAKVLPVVGRYFVDTGQGLELFETLNSVPKTHRQSDAFITWLLRSAVQAERQDLIIDEVLSYCETHDLPDALIRIAHCQNGWSRARRQGLLDRSRTMTNQTPFSIGHRLMLEPDHLCLPEALRALELAEREGYPGDVNEVILLLGQLYATTGNLRQGREWFLRAREHAKLHRLMDFRINLTLSQSAFGDQPNPRRGVGRRHRAVLKSAVRHHR